MYIIVFFLLFLFSSIEFMTKSVNKTAFNFLFFILTFMLVFRYGQGPDYIVYEHEYNTIMLKENLKEFLLLKGDYLFWIIALIFNYFNFPFELFVGLIALFSMICLYRFINNHSTYKFLSLFMFYCLYYIYFDTLIRQSIALSIIIVFAFDYIIKKEYFKAVLVTILASLFHQSALIVVFVIFLLKIKIINNIKILFISILFVLLSYFGAFEMLINMLPSFLRNRMAWYTNTQGNLASFLNRLFIYLIITFLIVLNSKVKKFSEKEKMLINLYSCFFLIYSIFFKFNLVASRLDVYFRILEIILIPNLIYNLKINYLYKKALLILSVFLVMNFYLWTNYYKNIQMVLEQGNYYTNKVYEYPYVSIFYKEKIYMESNYFYYEFVNKTK